MHLYQRLFLFLFFVSASVTLQAQVNSNNAAVQPQYDRNGRILGPATPGNDSLKRRDNTTDSITIYYRYFDSTRIRRLDSSINNFYNRFPLPSHYVHLGNLGTAARSLIFQPNTQTGVDPGFHAYDIYRLKIEDTKFYQTTRPYTELAYLIGSRSEQLVDIVHTQNIKPNFNMAFQYRFINSPGDFKNQNTSHNGYRINGVYQSNNKRYTAYLVALANKLRAGENGGIQNDSALIGEGFNDRYDIPTRLGGSGLPQRNPFNSAVTTGSLNNETNILLRQQYDLGQKDSIVVNDSTTIKLFYPRIRLQHTFNFVKNSFTFQDFAIYGQKRTDYLNYFNAIIFNDSVLYKDVWRNITNDFSIISFPVKNNPNQFLKLGVALQNMQGEFKSEVRNFYNVTLNAEYRNRTKNQLWDVEALGSFYAAGNNAGDYSAQISLRRMLSTRLGSLQLGFHNVNRTPSLLFYGTTSFPVFYINGLKKENITRMWGKVENPKLALAIMGEYNLISNYTYFNTFFAAQQESTLFNLLHLSAEKKFNLRRRWNLYSSLHVQQTSANAPVKVPFIYTEHRLAFEANLFKNLFLATGFEVRYHTPYKAPQYSPFIGQFVLQDTATVRNRPDIHAFFNFRIKSFKAFVRAENLNTVNIQNGFGFTKNNFLAPTYPNPGFWLRIGIWWTFVN